MNLPTVARVVLVGVLVTVLLGTLVLHGAGWALADPEQRAAGDDVADEAVVHGTVVAEHPVTVRMADGETVVLPDVDSSSVAEGEAVEVEVTVQRPGAATDEIGQEPWEAAFMYGISLLGAVLVLGRVLDTWRIDPRRLEVTPRDRRLHAALLERLRRDSDPAQFGPDGDRSEDGVGSARADGGEPAGHLTGGRSDD